MAGPGPRCLPKFWALHALKKRFLRGNHKPFRTPFEPAQRGESTADTVAVALGDHARINLAEGGHARRQHDWPCQKQATAQHRTSKAAPSTQRTWEGMPLAFWGNQAAQGPRTCKPSRLHVIMRLALQLELAARRCSLRECTWVLSARAKIIWILSTIASSWMKAPSRLMALFHFSWTEFSSTAWAETTARFLSSKRIFWAIVCALGQTRWWVTVHFLNVRHVWPAHALP